MRFWDASGVCLRLLYKLSTVRVFLTDTDPSGSLNAQGEDEWPPLRKVRPGDHWGWVGRPRPALRATHGPPSPSGGLFRSLQ